MNTSGWVTVASKLVFDSRRASQRRSFFDPARATSCSRAPSSARVAVTMPPPSVLIGLEVSKLK